MDRAGRPVSGGRHVVIAGGGFAGAWAAMGAAATFDAHGVEGTVTLVSREPWLTIRPRLYERAPRDVRVPLADVLAPLGGRCEVATAVGVDPVRRTLLLDGSRELPYDALVLATGSRLTRPSLPGAAGAYDVDTLAGAARLWDRIDAARAAGVPLTLAVVGGGLTGIELATELATELGVAGHSGARVLLLDAAEQVALGYEPPARAAIHAALAELGVEVHAGVRVAALQEGTIVLDGGARIDADVVAWTAGLEATPLPIAGAVVRDPLGRVVVGPDLRVAGCGELFVAGDAASIALGEDRCAPMSCQLAIPSGAVAGRNAAARVLGAPTEPFAYDGYVTCLDLGGAGAVFTLGWERRLVSAGAEGKQRKQLINRTLISPPRERDRLLAAGGRKPGAAAAIERAAS